MVKLEKRLQGDVVILDVDGVMDGGESCRQIQDIIKENLAAGRTRFVLDLSDVDWINSRGVGSIAAAASSVCRADASLCLAGLAPRVSSVLRTCRLVPQVLKDFPDEESALRSLRGSSG
jgi:anti-anti-sigma factor